MSGSVGDLPILTLQDSADVQGSVVYDCRPPLLPVSLQLCDLGSMAGRRPEGSVTVTVPPLVEEQCVEEMDFDGIAFPELGVAPLIASGTDLEDELPTSDDSPVSVGVCSAVAAEPEIRPALQGGIDLELAKALVSVMPSMITPIEDPDVDSRVSPAAYPVPPIPVVLVDGPVHLLEAPPIREVASSPVRECSPLLLTSPVGAADGPIPSRKSSSLWMADVPGPSPPRMAPMDQYLPQRDAQFGGSRRTLPIYLDL